MHGEACFGDRESRLLTGFPGYAFFFGAALAA